MFEEVASLFDRIGRRVRQRRVTPLSPEIRDDCTGRYSLLITGDEGNRVHVRALIKQVNFKLCFELTEGQESSA
jgi:hypothetical protein